MSAINPSIEVLESRTLLSSYNITDLHANAVTGGGTEYGAASDPDINAQGEALISAESATHIANHATVFPLGASYPNGLIDRNPTGQTQNNDGRDINDHEQVVGADSSTGSYEAFLSEYGKHGRQVITHLINLPGFTDSIAFAINNLGQVVGQSAPNSNLATAWIWQRGKHSREVITELPALGSHPVQPGFHEQTVANDINDSGAIVGMSVNDDLHQRAVIWRIGKHGRYGVTDLGALPTILPYSYARGINEAGLVVGNSLGSDGHQHAVLFAPGKKGRYSIVQLPDAPGLTGDFDALAVNNSNQIVGYVSTTTGDYDAILWQPGKHGRFTPVDLTNQGGNKWHLEEATDINDSGLIVGKGLYQNGETTWRLTPAASPAAAPAAAPANPLFSTSPIASDKDLLQ